MEIRQRHDNGVASAFWRRVVSEFTGGNFREVILSDDTWNGPVQFFVSEEEE